MGSVKAFILIAGLTILLFVLGDLIAAESGILLAFFISLMMIVSVYGCADKILLSLYQAKPMPDNDPSGVPTILASLAQKAQISKPGIYLVTNEAANAYIVGRKPAVVVTTGLLNLLNKDELTAVIAREMALIPHGEAMLGVASAMVSNFMTALADRRVWASLFGNKTKESKLNSTVMFVVGPIASFLVKLTRSDGEEFEWDAFGAKLSGNPLFLVTALEKLEANRQQAIIFPNAECHPGTAHLFIVNPLMSEKLSKQFATQPVTAERVLRLETMAAIEK